MDTTSSQILKMLDERTGNDSSCYVGCREMAKYTRQSLETVEAYTDALCGQDLLEKVGKEDVELSPGIEGSSFVVRITEKGKLHLKQRT